MIDFEVLLFRDILGNTAIIVLLIVLIFFILPFFGPILLDKVLKFINRKLGRAYHCKDECEYVDPAKQGLSNGMVILIAVITALFCLYATARSYGW